MIECSAENIWYKKRPRKKRRRFLIFVLVVLFLCGGILYYKKFVSENVFRICSDYSYTSATNAANKAIINVFSNEIEYDDIMIVSKNSSGEIEMLTANAPKINLFSRKIANITLTELERKLKEGIPVPSLSFTGIDLLSGYGRDTIIKTVTVADVTCDFASEFKSVGINQTLHSIYANVIINVNIELPLAKKTETHVAKVIVAETVLVGKVPEIYLNGGLFG